MNTSGTGDSFILSQEGAPRCQKKKKDEILPHFQNQLPHFSYFYYKLKGI
jgi:hypothetical protein